MHAFNKTDAAKVAAKTPIPRKDVIIDGIAKITMFPSMVLVDGFYPILMREGGVPYTSVRSQLVCCGSE